MLTPEELASRAWDGRPPGRPASWGQLRPDRWLAMGAVNHPPKEAVRFEGHSTTYRQLDALTNRAASGLLELGLRTGDVVGVLAENSPEVLALLFGLVRAGLTVLPLNPRSSQQEIDFQIADAGATFLIAPGAVSIDDVLAKGTEAPVEVDFDEDSFYHVRFTGGTTGVPKCLATPHRSVALWHERLARELGYSGDDVALAVAPLAHIAFHMVAATIVAGGTTVLLRSFDPRQLWTLCDDEEITHAVMVPTMLAMAMEAPGTAATLQQLFVTAAPFPPALQTKVQQRFPHTAIYQAYGATELGLPTLARPGDPPNKLGSVGRPAFGYSVRILDAEGRDLPPGEIGEIYGRGPQPFSFGYIGSVRMREDQYRDGWLTVGDLGYLDEDGYLWVVDRREDLIVSGGLNVYPAEVESVLMAHDRVVEAAVVGVTDDVWGHVVAAAVKGTATPEELDAHCRSRLAAYKVPRRYVSVDELPKSSALKVLRRVVRQQLESEAPGLEPGVDR